MGKLIYAVLMSLDGYIEDADGGFEWAQPDREVHQFVNDQMRPVGTHLYGRRIYEVLAGWDGAPTDESVDPVMADFARVWQAADKIVYSKTLTEPLTARTRIVGEFDLDEIERMKRSTDKDLIIGGAELAAEAIRAGLVDEYQLTVSPVIVGGGKRALPDGALLKLELLETKRFHNGSVFSRYKNS